MTRAENLVGKDQWPVGPLSESGDAAASRVTVPCRPPPRRLDFDVVVATRNRPQALALSIPLILGQSRLPKKLIVIDSSDDHAGVAETVARAVGKSGWNGSLVVEHSEPGLPRQRNRGLAHVDAEVVIFPDDDSLFHPGTSEAIMRAYELDTEDRIAGVCAADAHEPPKGALAEARYEMALRQKIKTMVIRHRHRLALDFNFLRPTLYVGRVLKSRYEPIDWFTAENCVQVEYMVGFRMSFRSAIIKALGFDETLTAYALGEDLDASFAAMRHGALVGARNARIYHHRFPTGRGDRFTLGMMRLMNFAYVTIKHAHDARFNTAEAKGLRQLVRNLSNFMLLRRLPFLFRRSDRQEFRGVLAALSSVRAMLEANREDLPRLYAEAQARIASERDR